MSRLPSPLASSAATPCGPAWTVTAGSKPIAPATVQVPLVPAVPPLPEDPLSVNLLGAVTVIVHVLGAGTGLLMMPARVTRVPVVSLWLPAVVISTGPVVGLE